MITHKTAPLAVWGSSSEAVSHTKVYSAWLGNASEAWLQVSPLLANLPKAGFNPLLSQGFYLLLYAPVTLALLFLFIFFSLVLSFLRDVCHQLSSSALSHGPNT